MAQKITVASPSAAVEELRPDWELVEALMGGTREMREAGQKYSPKWPAETDDAYSARLKVSVLFPAFQRTVSTLAAKPFSKPITINDDVPEAVQQLLADIDMQGRNLDRFAADVMECVTGYGMAGILVDFPDARDVPATESGVRTQAQEKAAGLRPYWVHIEPEQILGWRAKLVAGRWVLLMLRLMECVEEPDGEFGTKEVEQVRVLEPGRWRTFREVQKPNSAEKEWVQHQEGVTTLTEVPFVPCYGKRDGFMMGCPPLIELAHMNVAHWQSASDQQNILHVARVPILVAKNVADSSDATTGEVKPWELKIGAGAAVRISGQDCDLTYVEHTGKAIQAGADDLKALEDRMRQAGAELLVIGQGQKTRIEAAGENEMAMCALQRMTLAFEDALDQALDLTARWMGMGQGQGGHVELFRDFGAANLAEASAQLLLDANMAGKVSDETLHSELQRRGILSPDNDWAAEQDRLQNQGPSLGNIGDPTGAPAPSPAHGPTPAPGPTSAPLDLSPVLAAIEGLGTALAGSKPEPMDLGPLLAALAQQPTINVTAPPADLSPIAAAIAAMQPASVSVTGTDTAANNALVQTVAAGVEAMSAAAQALQKVAAELPAAVAAAAPKGITAEVNMPKRTSKAKFTTDAAGNITGASLTDE